MVWRYVYIERINNKGNGRIFWEVLNKMSNNMLSVSLG
jgi:hypothetical protein